MSGLLFAGELALAATIILFAAHALASFSPRASLRHLVRLGGLAALLLLPLAAFLPSVFVLQAGAPVAANANAAPDHAAHALAWVLIGVAALWAAGTLALLARGIAGAWALAMLHRRSRVHGFDTKRLADWAERAGFHGGWTLRFSAAVETPLSWGIFRPTILLPEVCADWDRGALDAAMLHELAHLSRRDAVSQALALMCCALYWPHPLVWVQARSLSADAETAADDAVIGAGVRPSDYAALLLHVAAGGRTAALGMAMAGRGGLEARIQSVLASNLSRSGVTKMQILKTASFGLGTVLLFALTRPTLAADPAAPQPTPVVGAQPLPTAAPSPQPDAQPSDQPSDQVVPARPARRARIGANAQQQNRTHVDVEVDAALAGANIDQKIADAHIGEKVAAALAQAHIGEKIAEALAKANIDQKIADAHIGEKIAEALAKANIDQKIADAHIGEKVAEALAKANIDQKIKEALQRLETDAPARGAPAGIPDAPGKPQ